MKTPAVSLVVKMVVGDPADNNVDENILELIVAGDLDALSSELGMATRCFLADHLKLLIRVMV